MIASSGAEAPAAARASDRNQRWFVGATWAVLTAGLFVYIFRYGSPVPWMDDWELVPVLTHSRPASLRWFWLLHNEHRLPLAKIVFLALNGLTGGDYRAGMVASAAVMSGVAFAAARVAARLRGRAAYTDAVFALALLHPGHEENLLALIQFFFVSACALATLVTILIAQGGWRTSARGALGLAAILALLPLNGAIGTLLAPPLALWAGWVAWRMRAGEAAARPARLLFAGAGAALALSAAYLVGFVRPPYHPPSPSVAAAARGGLQVLAMSLGPFGARAWPWSAAVLVALVAATLALLLGSLRTNTPERPRALGLVVALGAVLALLAATGISRAGLGPDVGFASRYAMLSAPVLPAVVFAWVLYGGRFALLVQASLFAVLCLALSINVRHALEYGAHRRAQADALLQDVRAGAPDEVLAQKHWRHFYPMEALLARRLRMLREAAHGPFRGGPRASGSGPCRQWHAAPVRPLGGHNMRWRDGIGGAEGPDPYVILGLLELERVCAVRFTVVHRSPAAEAPLKVYWARNNEGWFSEERHWAGRIPSNPDPQAILVWINDEVDLLRLDPDEGTVEFRVTAIELLTGR